MQNQTCPVFVTIWFAISGVIVLCKRECVAWGIIAGFFKLLTWLKHTTPRSVVPLAMSIFFVRLLALLLVPEMNYFQLTLAVKSASGQSGSTTIRLATGSWYFAGQEIYVESLPKICFWVQISRVRTRPSWPVKVRELILDLCRLRRYDDIMILIWRQGDEQ